MTPRNRRSGSVPCSAFYGNCMRIAKCGDLLSRIGALNINPPHRNLGCPLSASINRTIAARVLPTRSDIPISCGVLALAHSSGTHV